MVNLLIDIGNGRTKLALSTRDELLDRRETSTRELSLHSLNEVVAGWEFKRVIMCSVVPRASEVVQDQFDRQLTELRHDSDLGIGIRYPKPQSIGPDRLANAVALSVLYAKAGQPGVVIDFGTAVTFDVLSADHSYIGGVIAPGLRLMTDYLHERTALLPQVTLREPETSIGQSTEGAILAGAAIGYRGMVTGILEALKQELGGSSAPVVVATGGDAEWIVTGVPGVGAVDPDLTLHGLRLLANRTA